MDGKMALYNAMSLPIRGAWIEICIRLMADWERPESLPIRGAWIEICYVVRGHIGIASRSPSGERGLKWSVR